MKIQIDTDNKIIKLEQNVNLLELFNQLNNLLPNNLWYDFVIDVNTKIEWINPIYPNNPSPIQPYYPIIPNIPDNPSPWQQIGRAHV